MDPRIPGADQRAGLVDGNESLEVVGNAEVLAAVRALHRGESNLTPAIARKVLDQFGKLAQTSGLDGGPASPHEGGQEPAAALNEREEGILRLIAAGKTNRQIADTVFLAEGTVKNYVSRIMEKLHAATRTELVAIAFRQRR